MSETSTILLGFLFSWGVAIAWVWLFLEYLPKLKLRRKVLKLRVGNQYTLDGKDPFKQTRVVIDEIKAGYVSYRWIFKQQGEKDRLSETDSMKAESFARMYEEVATPGDQP